jgi:transcriptional regulator with XRE-family HTH domain
MATPSFGEKLKEERERRNTSIEEIAERTKIALHFLQALERDQFDELPGRAFGKFYIRAYAEVLDFDPESLILEYDKEQTAEGDTSGEAAPPEPARPRRVEAEIARWREARLAGQRTASESAEARGSDGAEPADAEEASVTASDESPPDEPEVRHEILDVPAPVPAFEGEEQGTGARYDEAAALASILGAHEAAPTALRRRRVIVAAVVGLVLLAIASWAIVTSLIPDETVVRGPAATVSDDSPPASPGPSVGPREDDAAADAAPPVPAPEPVGRSTPETTADPAGMAVSEFGVGRRIVNRRLENRGESFEEGSVVWFQTRVVGGARGENIRHVWLRDGQAVQTVDLELGGSHWRTHSRKTLWGTGRWAVEARDREGRILARSEFVCVPAG